MARPLPRATISGATERLYRPKHLGRFSLSELSTKNVKMVGDNLRKGAQALAFGAMTRSQRRLGEALGLQLAAQPDAPPRPKSRRVSSLRPVSENLSASQDAERAYRTGKTSFRTLSM